MGDREEDYALQTFFFDYSPGSVGFNKALEIWEFYSKEIADEIEKHGMTKKRDRIYSKKAVIENIE